MADQDYKFLAIKNWDKRQSGWRGKREWIKDYTEKDAHDDYEKLTFFQRYVLDGMRRIRGRIGKNIPNDPGYIARALHARRKDTPHVPHAVRTLTARGLLILTNQELDFVDIDIEKEEEIDKESTTPSARKARSKTDDRFCPFVEVLHRYHTKFVGDALKFELWFGRRGGKQLKSLLKAEPALDFHTFEKSVAVRARSPGVNHAQPVYEWVSHVISGPKGYSNGHATQINKADQRERQRDAGWAETLRKRNGTGGVSENGGSGLRPELERGAPGFIPGPVGPAREILSPRDHPRIRGSTD